MPRSGCPTRRDAAALYLCGSGIIHSACPDTTHSPFLVGPDELDWVRVVEMADRGTGTKVHTNVTASDPATLLPLPEALGYDLAQSLFHKVLR